MPREGKRRGGNPVSPRKTPIKRTRAVKLKNGEPNNEDRKVNKPSSSSCTVENLSNKVQNKKKKNWKDDKTEASFIEGEDSFLMKVQAEDLENFQREENEEVNEGDSEIVTFKNNLKSRNNNASLSRYSSQDSTDSEGELSSSDDSEGEDLQNKGNSGRDVNQARMKSQAKDKFVNQMMEAKGASSTKEEFIDAAVAKFQEVFMKSGFIETVNKLQKQLEEVEKEKNQKDTDATKVKQTGNKHCSSDSNKIKDSNRISKMLSQASNSELTIYQNAV